MSIIGPDCVVNVEGFLNEVNYLQENGFNIDLIKISPKAHIVTQQHIEEDLKKLNKLQGTTARGIAPCYSDKYKRIGMQVKDVDVLQGFIWNEKLYGKILCEGAQGFWLDINHGNYPYTTSSVTLPYGSCSLGFPPQKIRHIYGAVKIYDTRSGIDPLFPENLINDIELSQIIDLGKEYGVTTGRKRKVNWLNLDLLIKAINISGTTHVIISKIDILEKLSLYNLFYNSKKWSFDNVDDIKQFISDILISKCLFLKDIIYSNNPYKISDTIVSIDIK
jgi:adenylosuccinate synthase